MAIGATLVSFSAINTEIGWSASRSNTLMYGAGLTSNSLIGSFNSVLGISYSISVDSHTGASSAVSLSYNSSIDPNVPTPIEFGPTLTGTFQLVVSKGATGVYVDSGVRSFTFSAASTSTSVSGLTYSCVGSTGCTVTGVYIVSFSPTQTGTAVSETAPYSLGNFHSKAKYIQLTAPGQPSGPLRVYYLNGGMTQTGNAVVYVWSASSGGTQLDNVSLSVVGATGYSTIASANLVTGTTYYAQCTASGTGIFNPNSSYLSVSGTNVNFTGTTGPGSYNYGTTRLPFVWNQYSGYILTLDLIP